MREWTIKRFSRASWLLILTLVGCQQLALLSQLSGPDEPETDEDEFTTSVDTPMVGDYITVHGLNLITLEGVGLVTRLDGTGGDPPPSRFRTALVESMRKRGLREPNQLLRSPNTALVVVRAYLPPLVKKGEKFDVEVRLPGGSKATSLNGGWLMETYLSEQAVIPGQGVLSGHIFAKAKGPILISTGEGDDEHSLAGVLQRGRILGGGTYTWKEDRHLNVSLRNEFRSIRNSKRISDRIGMRFSAYNEHGLREPLADAKTDQSIVLKVHPRYKENYPRYLQAIRNIAFRETPVAQRVRMQKLEEELNTPETSELAALRLEAIGNDTVPILKRALNNGVLEVRFHAAMALAYLEESDGLETLAEAARTERAFRVFALAALAAREDAEANLLLRDLMNEESAELRYGAFRALWTSDPHDPFIRPEPGPEEFALHVLDADNEPMLHITHRRRAEIVLFGAGQKFLTPMAVRAGNHIVVSAPPGSNTITVSRFESGKTDERKVVSPLVADVITAVAELGASYPDVAGMIIQATKQHNIAGRVEIDALPQAGRIYYRPRVNGSDGLPQKARVGKSNSHLTPNMFPTKDEDSSDETSSQERTGRSESLTESEKASPDTPEETQAAKKTNADTMIAASTKTGCVLGDDSGSSSADMAATATDLDESPQTGWRKLLALRC